MNLLNDRYFSSVAAASSLSPPGADYVLENNNADHAPGKPYYADVHSFETLGGTYSVQWDAGNGRYAYETTVADTVVIKDGLAEVDHGRA